jgi:sugar lactone lactonase YvrE
VDPAGRLYGLDCAGAAVLRLDPDGPVVVAGSGTAGYAGDGGPATEARLVCPIGLAFDDRGMFIVDHGNNRIRLVDASGTISTFAGNGPTGFGLPELAGDGGQASDARFQEPVGIAIADGDMYITDRDNEAVRRIDASGVITTIAGQGAPSGFEGDGGPGASARLSGPVGVAVGADGSVYVADSNNQRVRRIDSAGVITTVAGIGVLGSDGDGGPAIEASLADPQSVAIDAGGNLYISETLGQRIRRVALDGTITTFAGTGASGSSGDGGPAIDAAVGPVTAIVIGPDGALSFWSAAADCLRSVDTDGIIDSTWCLRP